MNESTTAVSLNSTPSHPSDTSQCSAGSPTPPGEGAPLSGRDAARKDTAGEDTTGKGLAANSTSGETGQLASGTVQSFCWALVCGGLILGGTLSLLHLRLNEVTNVLVALASWFWFTVLFAGLAVAMVVPVAVLCTLLAKISRLMPGPARRWFTKAADMELAHEGAVRWQTVFGLRAFVSIYLVVGLLYGLTYDQTALSVQGWVGMYLFLAFAAAVIVALSWWTVGKVVAWIGAFGAPRLVPGVGLAFLIAHLAFATLQGAEPLAPRRDAGAVEVVAMPTGTQRSRLADGASGDEIGQVGGQVGAAGKVEDLGLSVTPGQGSEVGEGGNGSGPNVVPVGSLENQGLTARFPTAHVILLGFDGLDPKVLDRLVAEDLLPNFQRFRREGIFAPLETLPSANSSVIWSTIYTGTLPDAHGVHDFFKIRLPGLGDGFFPVHRTWFQETVGVLEKMGIGSKVLVDRRNLGRFPVWEIVDHFGVSAGVIDGYLNSYPAQALDSKDSYFIAYGSDLFAEQVEQGTMDMKELGSFVQPVDLLLDEGLPRGADFEWQSAMALQLLRGRRQPRLLNLYSHQPDALQHEAWKSFEPWRYRGGDPGDGLQDASGGEIVALHESFDLFLGAVHEAAAPGTVFVLVSDHGHSATVVHRLATQHRHGPDGVLMLWGAGVVAGATVENPHVVDVVPTILALLGLPVADDMPGRVWLEGFEPSLVELSARTIESYEGMWRAPAVGAERDPRLLQAELDKLKSMGYLN